MVTTPLPDVTLIAIDGVAHDLVRLALIDTLAQVEPAQVIVFSDRPILADSAIWIRRELDSFQAVARTLWYEVPRIVRTSHVLTIQYDGWVIDGSAWEPAWLRYDYVGAPWDWHTDGRNVGNGGFSLRSTELLSWLARRPARYPVEHPEDDRLCRVHRPALERDGFRWATWAEAERFSTERTSDRGTFGFHGLFRWPDVLDPAALRQRLALSNPYVRSNPAWNELMTQIGTPACTTPPA